MALVIAVFLARSLYKPVQRVTEAAGDLARAGELFEPAGGVRVLGMGELLPLAPARRGMPPAPPLDVARTLDAEDVVITNGAEPVALPRCGADKQAAGLGSARAGTTVGNQRVDAQRHGLEADEQRQQVDRAREHHGTEGREQEQRVELATLEPILAQVTTGEQGCEAGAHGDDDVLPAECLQPAVVVLQGQELDRIAGVDVVVGVAAGERLDVVEAGERDDDHSRLDDSDF